MTSVDMGCVATAIMVMATHENTVYSCSHCILTDTGVHIVPRHAWVLGAIKPISPEVLHVHPAESWH